MGNAAGFSGEAPEMAELWVISNLLAEDMDARIPEAHWREQMKRLEDTTEEVAGATENKNTTGAANAIATNAVATAVGPTNAVTTAVGPTNTVATAAGPTSTIAITASPSNNITTTTGPTNPDATPAGTTNTAADTTTITPTATTDTPTITASSQRDTGESDKIIPCIVVTKFLVG